MSFLIFKQFLHHCQIQAQDNNISSLTFHSRIKFGDIKEFLQLSFLFLNFQEQYTFFHLYMYRVDQGFRQA